VISVPVMMKYGLFDSPTIGVIAASGTITQLIPPVPGADRARPPASAARSGDMYAGAIVPAIIHVGACSSIWLLIGLRVGRKERGSWHCPLEARTLRLGRYGRSACAASSPRSP